VYRSSTKQEYADALHLTNVDGHGLGWTAPSWLQSIYKAAVSGQAVTVQTPTGPQVIRLDDPSAAKEIVAAIAPKVSYGAPAPAPGVTLPAIPGGGFSYAGIAALAVAALLILPRVFKR
jgi:hypothetical protein